MSIIKIQQQDKDGNIIHQETDSSIVKVGNDSLDIELSNIQSESYPTVEAVGTNKYTGLNARIKSLTKGIKFTLFVDTDATDNCTLNLNSFGDINLKDSFGNIVKNLKKDIPYNVCYNGTDFILQGKGGGGNLTPEVLIEGYDGTGDNGKVIGLLKDMAGITNAINVTTSGDKAQIWIDKGAYRTIGPFGYPIVQYPISYLAKLSGLCGYKTGSITTTSSTIWTSKTLPFAPKILFVVNEYVSNFWFYTTIGSPAFANQLLYVSSNAGFSSTVNEVQLSGTTLQVKGVSSQSQKFTYYAFDV